MRVDAAPLRYLALLDSAHFGHGVGPQEQSHASLRATRHLFQGLLVDGVIPVLSETQAFDNQMLLDLVANEDADSSAFLRIVRSSRLRMRMLATRPSADTVSLVDAFLDRLDTGFTFSAWPDVSDPEVAASVRAALTGDPTTALPDELADRVRALLLLDRQFRWSVDDERAVPPRGRSLSRRVVEELEAPSQTPALRQVWREIQAVSPESPREFDLDRRSDWRALLDYAAERLGRARDQGLMATVSRLVDHHYNLVVAESMGAESVTAQFDGAGQDPLARAVMQDRPEVSLEESRIVSDRELGTGLQWRDVPDLLRDLEVLSRRGRVRWLRDQGFITATHESNDTWLVRLGRATARRVGLDGVTAVSAAAIGAVVGGVPGALVGAVVEVGVRAATESPQREASSRQAWLLRSAVPS